MVVDCRLYWRRAGEAIVFLMLLHHSIMSTSVAVAFSIFPTIWRGRSRCHHTTGSHALLFLQNERWRDLYESVAEQDPEWYSEFVLDVLDEDPLRGANRSSRKDMMSTLNPYATRNMGNDNNRRIYPEPPASSRRIVAASHLSDTDLTDFRCDENNREKATHLEPPLQLSDTIDRLVTGEAIADMHAEQWKYLNETGKAPTNRERVANSTKIAEETVKAGASQHSEGIIADQLLESSAIFSKVQSRQTSADEDRRRVGDDIAGKTSQEYSLPSPHNEESEDTLRPVKPCTTEPNSSFDTSMSNSSSLSILEHDMLNTLPRSDSNASEGLRLLPTENAYTVLYRDLYTGDFRSHNLTSVTALGYSINEIRYLQPDALGLILEEKIRKPIRGIPQHWQISRSQYEFLSDDIRVVREEEMQACLEVVNVTEPSFTMNRKAAANDKNETSDTNERMDSHNNLFGGKKGVFATRKSREYDETEGFIITDREKKEGLSRKPTRSRGTGRRNGSKKQTYSAPRVPKISDQTKNDDPPSPSNPFWVDMDTFRDLLRSEAELRVRILGEDWADIVRDESSWRLSLYKEWLWALKRGIGNPLIPSRSDRALAQCREPGASAPTDESRSTSADRKRPNHGKTGRKISINSNAETSARPSKVVTRPRKAVAARRNEDMEDDLKVLLSQHPRGMNRRSATGSQSRIPANADQTKRHSYSSKRPRRGRQIQSSRSLGRKKTKNDIGGNET